MYSDGFISKATKYTNYFGLTVHSKDVEWLEKFKDFLHYNGKIHHYKVSHGYKLDSPYSRLQVGNNKIVQDLESYGVVEHKSLVLDTVPNIPYLFDFVRGYIDGNGSIHKVNGGITISGPKALLLNIANIVDKEYKIYKDKSIYELYYRPIVMRPILKQLYENAHYYLERKYRLAERYF